MQNRMYCLLFLFFAFASFANGQVLDCDLRFTSATCANTTDATTGGACTWNACLGKCAAGFMLAPLPGCDTAYAAISAASLQMGSVNTAVIHATNNSRVYGSISYGVGYVTPVGAYISSISTQCIMNVQQTKINMGCYHPCTNVLPILTNGTILEPGVYCSDSLTVPAGWTIYLNGEHSSNTFVFRLKSINMGSGASIVATGPMTGHRVRWFIEHLAASSRFEAATRVLGTMLF